MTAYTTDKPVFPAKSDEEKWLKASEQGGYTTYISKTGDGFAYSDGLNTLFQMERFDKTLFSKSNTLTSTDTWNGNPIADVQLECVEYGHEPTYTVSVRGFTHTHNRLRDGHTQADADASMQEMLAAINDAMKSVEWMKQVLRDHAALA